MCRGELGGASGSGWKVRDTQQQGGPKAGLTPPMQGWTHPHSSHLPPPPRLTPSSLSQIETLFCFVNQSILNARPSAGAVWTSSGSLNPKMTLEGSHRYSSYFTNEETEAQRRRRLPGAAHTRSARAEVCTLCGRWNIRSRALHTATCPSGAGTHSREKKSTVATIIIKATRWSPRCAKYTAGCFPVSSLIC